MQPVLPKGTTTWGDNTSDGFGAAVVDAYSSQHYTMGKPVGDICEQKPGGLYNYQKLVSA
jgi:hypothetical protein